MCAAVDGGFAIGTAQDQILEAVMYIRLFPLAIIAVGAVFLGVNMGVVPASEVKALMSTWWPLLLVLVGLSLLGRRRHRHGTEDRR
jgi:hypothetical protein